VSSYNAATRTDQEMKYCYRVTLGLNWTVDFVYVNP
jgi:hypothetical protein